MTTLTSQKSWTDYFVRNREQLLDIEWMDSYELTAHERAVITRSIQQFQLGEQSEGKRFIYLAEQYVARTGDTDYLEALHLFIAEEQRHARHLARFMHQHHIPCIESHLVDSVFRWLRRLFNLELEIVVLLSAEVIACTFYKALHDATNSKTLRDLCRQILTMRFRISNFNPGPCASFERGAHGWTLADTLARAFLFYCRPHGGLAWTSRRVPGRRLFLQEVLGCQLDTAHPNLFMTV